jgi:pteridine reductase
VAALTAKRALVTGAGVRVGRAIAVALGKAGARVAVHYHRSAAGALETCELVRSAGGEATMLQADLEDRQQLSALTSQTLELFGGLDILVPSAANFDRVPLNELSALSWDRALALNLTAPFLLVMHCAEALRRSHGTVVFVTCSSTQTPFLHHLPYVVSKGGLRQLMRVLALELAPEVRVNAVAPGTVLPPPTMQASEVQQLVDRIPVERAGSAEDVADAVVYLASAPFVTGHELVVDGGRSVAAVGRFG